jgi:hypothetical protein
MFQIFTAGELCWGLQNPFCKIGILHEWSHIFEQPKNEKKSQKSHQKWDGTIKIAYI